MNLCPVCPYPKICKSNGKCMCQGMAKERKKDG